MERFLILKLEGVLQAWGEHTFEDFRPSHGFPTLSGLLGLLGACLGIERADTDAQKALAASVAFAVRADDRRLAILGSDRFERYRATRMTDFHTVLDARKVGGKRNEYPVVSSREYLCDAAFTVAIQQCANAVYTLDQIAEAVRKPVYTPSLGRRSCPLSRPLFHGMVDAENLVAALRGVDPAGGVIYSESGGEGQPQLRLRDRPIHGRPRQFASRRVYVYAGEEE